MPHSSPKQQKRIMVGINRTYAYSRDVITGILRFAHKNPHWRVRLASTGPGFDKSLREWQADGFITDSAPFAETFQPSVLVSNSNPPPAIPRVGVDDIAVGRLAARYFIEKGYRHFCFIGTSQNFSKQRLEGFQQTLATHQFKPITFTFPLSPALKKFAPIAEWLGPFEDWLRNLPNPIAILVSNDELAARVSEAAHAAQLLVPQQLAILGVDNDIFICNSAEQPLSSIAIPGIDVGLRAAELLHTLLSKRKHPPAKPRKDPIPILLPPLAVVSRTSTDYLALADPELVTATEFIHATLDQPLSIPLILARTHSSRRSFERKFRSQFHQSPSEYIRAKRIHRAIELLRETTLPLKTVATRCGFSSYKHLASVFLAEKLPTPGAHRRS